MIWAEEAGRPGAALVVLVHGSMDRSAGLLRLSRRLAHEHRVLRYDRRGYGRSTPHPGPFRMADQVADLVGLLDGRTAVLFGHSLGGDVALATAARHPGLVPGAVVYEPPLSWLPWWPSTSAGTQALTGSTDPADAAEQFMRRLVGDHRWERLPPGTRAARRREGAAMIGELVDLRARAPWHPDELTMPLVAMHGEHGAPHHRRAVEQLAAWIPGCEISVVGGAKHFGPNTHAGAVADAVARLVRRVGSV